MIDDARVKALAWDAGELTIAYETAGDLRDIAGDPVLRLAQIIVPARHRSYADEIDDLRHAALALLLDVLEDYEQAKPFVESEEDDDADEDDEE